MATVALSCAGERPANSNCTDHTEIKRSINNNEHDVGKVPCAALRCSCAMRNIVLGAARRAQHNFSVACCAQRHFGAVTVRNVTLALGVVSNVTVCWLPCAVRNYTPGVALCGTARNAKRCKNDAAHDATWQFRVIAIQGKSRVSHTSRTQCHLCRSGATHKTAVTNRNAHCAPPITRR